MTEIIEFQTERLLLRQWNKSDWIEFSELNKNPDVMTYFPNCLSQSESNSLAQRIQNGITDNGWGFWAVEVRGIYDFVGFVGLNIPTYALPFSPCVEIGWRLSSKFWNKGYATEAAQGALRIGFTQLGLTKICAFTSVHNQRSIKVMQRLNMAHTGKFFDHPLVPEGSRLRRHCLYELTQEQWEKNNCRDGSEQPKLLTEVINQSSIWRA